MSQLRGTYGVNRLQNPKLQDLQVVPQARRNAGGCPPQVGLTSNVECHGSRAVSAILQMKVATATGLIVIDAEIGGLSALKHTISASRTQHEGEDDDGGSHR